MSTQRFWIAVACAEHVRRGHESGFMQACHGKAAPLKRIKPGDGIVYYSPTKTLGGKDRVQAFTAIGHVRSGEVYAFDMGGGFVPARRDVDWLDARDVPIASLLDQLAFTRGRTNWGYQFRFGVFEVEAGDFAMIREAMTAPACVA